MSRPDLDDIRERYDSVCKLTEDDAKAGSLGAAIAYSLDVPALLDYVADLEANWPDGVRPSGEYATWPIEAPAACKAGSVDNVHYCTLAKGHLGDHLTLTARWRR